MKVEGEVIKVKEYICKGSTNISLIIKDAINRQIVVNLSPIMENSGAAEDLSFRYSCHTKLNDKVIIRKNNKTGETVWFNNETQKITYGK